VQFWSFGKLGLSGSSGADISHTSHRSLEKGCVKQIVYVKRVFRGHGMRVWKRRVLHM
jgi:hypothetical protein